MDVIGKIGEAGNLESATSSSDASLLYDDSKEVVSGVEVESSQKFRIHP